MSVPGEIAMPIEQLREAVPGLAGIAGALLFPTIASWGRLVLEYLESNRAGLTRPKRVSGKSALKAVVLSVALCFFILTLYRAAGQLRGVQLEAPVVGPSIQGILVGVGVWAVYALGVSALRRASVRRLNERRVGGGLR